MPTVALIDADNTLWDTDAVFSSAQLTLLSLVEAGLNRLSNAGDRLRFIRNYDQALALKHHLHLRYPPQMLVRALEAGLDGIPPDRAADNAIGGKRSGEAYLSEEAVQSIVAAFVDALSKVPPLLPNVREGLTAAQQAGFSLYVMTEGKIERQKKLLDVHALQNAFEGVWELTKSKEQFDRLLARFPGRRVIVVGDQADRDIIPAKLAGCTTVFVPSKFTPSWNEKGEQGSADFVAADLLQGISWCISTTESR